MDGIKFLITYSFHSLFLCVFCLSHSMSLLMQLSYLYFNYLIVKFVYFIANSVRIRLFCVHVYVGMGCMMQISKVASNVWSTISLLCVSICFFQFHSLSHVFFLSSTNRFDRSTFCSFSNLYQSDYIVVADVVVTHRFWFT